MPIRSIQGGEALALGALAAGIRSATSYPGSPSSEVIEALIGRSRDHDLRVEWASNERVALETAIGVSIAGHRALVCTKSVGMNVMLDPLMVLNLTPVHGGLVIVLGDDPGGYGSQNDQDTRPLATLLEMPMLEPSTPAEAFRMMVEAFDLSERFQTPIIVRETRSFAQSSGTIELPEAFLPRPGRGILREPWRFVPVPANVVAKHRALHDRIGAFAAWAETSPYLESSGSGDLGVIDGRFRRPQARRRPRRPAARGTPRVPPRPAPPAPVASDRPMARGVPGSPGRRGDRAVPGTRDPGDRPGPRAPDPHPGEGERAPSARGRALPLANPRGPPRLAA